MQDYLKHNSVLALNKVQQKKNMAADKPIVFNSRIVSSGYSQTNTKGHLLTTKLSKSSSLVQLTDGKTSRKTSMEAAQKMKSVANKLDFVFELPSDFKNPVPVTEKGLC